MRFFSDNDLIKVLEQQNLQMKEKIDRYTNDEIMANDLELLSGNCFEEFKVEPLIIGEEEFDKRTIVQKKILKRVHPFYRDEYSSDYFEVDGIVMKYYYPYVGDVQLFRCRASTFSLSGYPEAELVKGFIVLTYEVALNEMQNEESKNKFNAELSRNIGSIKKGAGFANSDVIKFNTALLGTARNMLSEKRKKVEQYFAISNMFEVPLKKNDFAETHIPMQRKIIPIAKKYNDVQSYFISDDEYKFILETIKHNGSTYERTPSSYKAMHEEDLRNTLLAALNGMYRGAVNGETFRNNGKTDICIEKENRAAFVAECKMWTGQGSVAEAIKQLDSYLTWRDCKTALIYFVRNKDFLKAISAARQALESIQEKRKLKEIDMNEFECSFLSLANPGQLISVRVMLFNLYSD